MPGYTISPGADTRAVAAVLDRVEREATACGLPPQTVDRVALIAGEAVANAVEHGGGRVTVEWEPTSSGGILRISGGGGPGLEEIGQARLPPSLTATRGRGLYLIQQLADRIELAPEGLQLWVEPRDGE